MVAKHERSHFQKSFFGSLKCIETLKLVQFNSIGTVILIQEATNTHGNAS